jgi:hypothetical protein
MNAVDLSALEASDTATLEVNALTGEPMVFNGTPVTVVLYGPGSEQAIKAQAKADAGEQAKAFAAIRGKPSKDTPDAARRARAERLAACTESITGLPIAPLDVYLNPKLGYITNQVERFAGDWANFLPRPASV